MQMQEIAFVSCVYNTSGACAGEGDGQRDGETDGERRKSGTTKNLGYRGHAVPSASSSVLNYRRPVLKKHTLSLIDMGNRRGYETATGEALRGATQFSAPVYSFPRKKRGEPVRFLGNLDKIVTKKII